MSYTSERRGQCPYPNDVNPLTPNGFVFMIERIQSLSYFCQAVSLPAISLPTVKVSTPLIRYPVPGDEMDFENLNVEFLVDSQMKNYIALFRWLRGLGFPDSHSQYTEQVEKGIRGGLSEATSALSDASLVILGNDNEVIQTVVFSGCVITALNTLPFNSMSTDVQYLVGSASFQYRSYDFR